MCIRDSFPILLLCDEKGNYINLDEIDLVSGLEQIDDMDVRYFTPAESEMKLYQRDVYKRQRLYI